MKGGEDNTEHKRDKREAEPKWPELHENIERELKRLREQCLQHCHEIRKWNSNSSEDSSTCCTHSFLALVIFKLDQRLMPSSPLRFEPCIKTIEARGRRYHFFPRKIAVSLKITKVINPIVGATTYIIITGKSTITCTS